MWRWWRRGGRTVMMYSKRFTSNFCFMYARATSPNNYAKGHTHIMGVYMIPECEFLMILRVSSVSRCTKLRASVGFETITYSHFDIPCTCEATHPHNPQRFQLVLVFMLPACGSHSSMVGEDAQANVCHRKQDSPEHSQVSLVFTLGVCQHEVASSPADANRKRVSRTHYVH